MKTTLRVVLPIAVLLAGLAAALAMIRARPAVEREEPTPPAPAVRVLPAEPRDLRLRVRSQGTVEPRVESQIVAEVAGRVVHRSPSLADGAFFAAGEELLRIDARDYELARVGARAEVARAELLLAREREEAAQARRDWEELGRGEPSPLVVREPQLAEAEASLEAARAALAKTELDLERTRVRAPFAGRVRARTVDVGQYVVPGTPVAVVYAVDAVEVRLPLPDAELAYVDLPLGYAAQRGAGPEVELHADFAGERHVWKGRVVRTDGAIDPRTRMVHAIVEVRDPYGRTERRGQAPLAVGMFVHAEILGDEVEDVFVVPRAAMRDEDELLVVDEDDRLRFRRVEVLRAERDQVILSAGVEPGERICLSPLDVVVDGMAVRPVVDEDARAVARAEETLG